MYRKDGLCSPEGRGTLIYSKNGYIKSYILHEPTRVECNADFLEKWAFKVDFKTY